MCGNLGACFYKLSERGFTVKYCYLVFNLIAYCAGLYDSFYYVMYVFCSRCYLCLADKLCFPYGCIVYDIVYKYYCLGKCILPLAFRHYYTYNVARKGGCRYCVHHSKLMLFYRGVFYEYEAGYCREDSAYLFCYFFRQAYLEDRLKAEYYLFGDLLLLELVPDVCRYKLLFFVYENCRSDHIGYEVHTLYVYAVLYYLGYEDAEHIVRERQYVVYCYYLKLGCAYRRIVYEDKVCYAKYYVHYDRGIFYYLKKYVVEVCYYLFLNLALLELRPDVCRYKLGLCSY